jgi:hypothetical protein
LYDDFAPVYTHSELVTKEAAWNYERELAVVTSWELESGQLEIVTG